MIEVKPLLEMKNISKAYNGNVVLTDVSFSLKPGEVVGLVGENGAGKSTLMNILFGMNVIRDTGGYGGQIFIDGKEVNFSSPSDALKAGIGMVHQEFSLLPDFTATENIVLNREPEKKNVISLLFGDRANTLDRKKMLEISVDAINKLGVDLDPEMLISTMPVGHKQFTEISREISKPNIKLLVLDEPTAVLAEKEAEALLDSIRKLSKAGISVIFITHRLQEILDVADTVLVMRDGKLVSSLEAKETSVGELARLMVGRDVKIVEKDANEASKNEQGLIMKVEKLWVDMPGEAVQDVSLEIRKGEILGIGGLAGQGKLGIPNGIMGLYPAGGEITLFTGEKNTKIPLNSPSSCLKANLAYVSEDRRGVGLLLDESLEWNISFTAMQAQNKYLKKFGFIHWRDRKAIEDVTNKYIDMLQIKCTSSKQKARELSGGNQQKICLAKAFALEPDLLFVSEPTRGIDIGAKNLVLSSLQEYNRNNGTTVVMISSELEELRQCCDRIAIVTDGKISGILPASSPSEEFGILMVGNKEKENENE